MLKNSIKEIVNFINRKEIISPVTIAKLRFIYKFRRLPNFKNPVDLNEKINYLKFYTDTSSWVNLTDKYRVREYISNLGFKNNLVKLYAIWDSANDIDLSILPNSFVLKANNGCGDVIICNNNNDLNENKVKEYFSDILNHHYGIDSGELHYTKIKPCIIAEELLDSTKQMVESTSLIDYKIWCLNGEPEVIWCAWDRTKHSIKTALYDTRWNYIPDKQIFTPPHFINGGNFIPKPHNLDEMLNFAREVANGFPIVRVDVYLVDNKLYFGEMTFTSYGGFMDYFTPSFLKDLGEKVNLP